jgi:predicted RNA-binding protein YlxR (DUF448 family)
MFCTGKGPGPFTCLAVIYGRTHYPFIFIPFLAMIAMRSIPMRQCVVCRKKSEKGILFRAIRTPDNQILFDPLHKMNGRGVYICKNAVCIQKARKKDLIGLTFQLPVSAELYMQLAEALQSEQKSSMETLIGFANRSRNLIKGITGIVEGVEKKKIKLLILDPETKATTRKRIESIGRKQNIPLIVYSGERSLSDILGKANCRCIGITDDQFARSILKQME